jgi:perosamine synthetase
MLLLDDDQLFARCKFLRDHGRAPGTYFNTEITFKYMPFNLQAALGYAQFQRIDELVGRKRWLLEGYRQRLADIPDLKLNPDGGDVYNGVWSAALIFGKSHSMTRDKALEEMPRFGVPVRPFFYPLTFLPAFNREEQGRHDNPMAYDVSEHGIALPCALNLTDDDLDEYCRALRRLLGYQ